VMIVSLIGLIGLIAPPNNWDSMDYHMSRIIHWMQNKNVTHYPTHITRQLHLSPFAEFAIMQFQLLSGSDYFANMIQWFSLLGSMVGVSLIAKELGANVTGQLFATTFCATLPMGILQASSTQNDFVAAFWLVCFVYYLIRLRNTGKYLEALAVGVSLGLALFTKATAYIYAFPFLAWLGISSCCLFPTKIVRFAILMITVICILNGGHALRNYQLDGHPLGSKADTDMYSNKIFTASALASNMLRNLTNHIGTPWKNINQWLENGVTFFHKVIGFSANDRRTTFGRRTFSIIPFSLHEDGAGNALHLSVFMVCFGIWFFFFPKINQLTLYCLCIVAMFVLFSLYLKWQPWHSRLHLPFFFFFSPFAGVILSQMPHRNVGNMIIVSLLLGTIPWIFYNNTRPIFFSQQNNLVDETIFYKRRNELYFANRPLLVAPYFQAAAFISAAGCHKIGMYPGVWEYPLWVLLGDQMKHHIQIEHLAVSNSSQKIYQKMPYFIPCSVIMSSPQPPKQIVIGNKMVYLRKAFYDPVSIFMPVDGDNVRLIN